MISSPGLSFLSPPLLLSLLASGFFPCPLSLSYLPDLLGMLLSCLTSDLPVPARLCHHCLTQYF